MTINLTPYELAAVIANAGGQYPMAGTDDYTAPVVAPTRGRIGSGLDAAQDRGALNPDPRPWDETGDVYKRMAIAAAGGAADPLGVPSMMGVPYLQEMQAQDPGAAAMGQIASPLVGPLASGAGKVAQGVGAAARSAPQVAAAVAAALGLTAGASQAGDELTEQAPKFDLSPLYQQQQMITEQMHDAKSRMDAEGATGRGSKFRAAESEFRNAQSSLESINRQIADGMAQNSPAARQAQASEAAKIKRQEEDAARLARANMPFKELAADYMPYVAPAAALAAGAAGYMIRKPYINRYNEKAQFLADRLKTAVTPGETYNPALAGKLAEKASAFPKTPPGTWAAVGTGAGIGELSQLMPLAIDYQRAIPGSDLEKKVKEQMTDPYGIAGRLVQGALLGGIPAKIGSSLAARGTKAPLFLQEEGSLLPQPPAMPSGPGGSQGPMVPGSQPGNQRQISSPADAFSNLSPADQNKVARAANALARRHHKPIPFPGIK